MTIQAPQHHSDNQLSSPGSLLVQLRKRFSLRVGRDLERLPSRSLKPKVERI